MGWGMEDIEKRDCFKNHRTGKKRITEKIPRVRKSVCVVGVSSSTSHSIKLMVLRLAGNKANQAA